MRLAVTLCDNSLNQLAYAPASDPRSFYFQSESFLNVIEGNIAYNGPRAGVNVS